MLNYKIKVNFKFITSAAQKDTIKEMKGKSYLTRDFIHLTY